MSLNSPSERRAIYLTALRQLVEERPIPAPDKTHPHAIQFHPDYFGFKWGEDQRELLELPTPPERYDVLVGVAKIHNPR